MICLVLRKKQKKIICHFNMKKEVKKKITKPRAKKYEPKVKFDGTFEDMIAISITGAGAKPKKKDTTKSK